MNSDDSIPYFNPPLERKPGSNLEARPEEAFDTSRWVMPKDVGDHITKDAIDKWQDKRSLPKPTPMKKRNIPIPVGGNHTTHNSTSNAAAEGVVIISTSIYHSAKELCYSEFSWGHDFVSSSESLFCDMDLKNLWPVCSHDGHSACFDTNTSMMRPGKGLRGRDSKSGQVPPEKNYAKTIHWD